jgi:outer membrane protein
MSKKIVGIALIALFLNLGLVRAEADPSYKVGIVDMQKALQTVEAGKKAKTQLQKEFDTKKKMISDEENAIRKLSEEFKKQSLAFSEETRMKKQQEIQERIMKLQETTGRSQMEIQQKEQEMTAPLVKNLKIVIQELAAKKGYALVLDKNDANVLFSQDKDDFTAEAISAFNAKNK